MSIGSKNDQMTNGKKQRSDVETHSEAEQHYEAEAILIEEEGNSEKRRIVRH